MFHSRCLLYFGFSLLFYNFYILLFFFWDFNCSLLKVQSEGNTYFLTDQKEFAQQHAPFFEVDLRFSYVFVRSTLFYFILFSSLFFFLLMTEPFSLNTFPDG